MELVRKLHDIQKITLEEVLILHKRSGWCFRIADGKIGSITIEK